MFASQDKVFDINFLRQLYKRNWTVKAKTYVDEYFAKSTLPTPCYVFWDADDKKCISIPVTELKFHLPIKAMRIHLKNHPIHYKMVDDESYSRVYKRKSGQWIITNNVISKGHSYEFKKSCFVVDDLPKLPDDYVV